MFAELIFAASLAVANSTAEGPFQEMTFDQALAAAKKDGKVVMIDFFTTWCGPCKRLDKVTWADAGVQKWLAEKTVPLKMDAEKEVELAKRFEIRAYPTIVFVKTDGSKLDAIVGFKPPEEFLGLAKDALAGRTSEVRVGEKLEAAKKGLGGHENDPMERQKFGDELARAGKYPEALAEYLWCFDHGLEYQPAYTGVRVSFLLSSIVELGKNHPPALAALKERRDKAQALLLSNEGTTDTARDLAALNGTLLTPENTVATFDQLRNEHRLKPEVRAALLRDVAETLVDAKRWKDLAEDPEAAVQQANQEIETWKRVARSRPGSDEEVRKAMESAQSGFRLMIVRRASVWYEALLGVGETNKAAEVASSIIELAPLGTTYATLIQRALHADAVEAARALAERGRASLSREEQSAFETTAQLIPAKK